MREVSRAHLGPIRDRCTELGIGIDISLRFRTPLKVVAGKSTVAQAKESVRRSTELCLTAVHKRLGVCAEAIGV